jgi:hypothetical protein
LFSPDREVHEKYVNKVRKDMVIAFREAWELVKELERASAQDPNDSFFSQNES